MEIPASTAAIAVLVALVVPGLVYASVRTSLTGYRGTDRSLSSRFAQAVTIGVLVNAVCLAFFGRVAYGAFTFAAQREQVMVSDPVGAGRTVIVLGLAVPALAALVIHGIPWRRIPAVETILNWLNRVGVIVVNRVPTAWDQAGRRQSDVFLRITRADGRIVGGWYGRGSFMSGYPEGRDVYIATQWRLDEEGRFVEAMSESAGLWTAVRDDDILEWIHPEAEQI